MSDADLPTYCFDTSAWIHAWDRAYPLDNFPGVWGQLTNLVAEGRLVSPDEVREEIERKDDELLKWLRDVEGLFVPIDDQQQDLVREILQEEPRLVDSSKGRDQADPWVIALAEARAAVVVTQEGRRPTNPRIPDVCAARDLSFFKLLEVIQVEEWSFS